MQALILAAGRGSRLGGKAGETSKCLVEVGRKPLIEHQLEALSAAGVGAVCMVVGFAADEVQELVGIRADYVHNPRWRTTNSLYSFWLAREWLRGDILVLNCDVLFDPAILERLLAAKGDALVYDSGSGDGREQMSVRVEGGVLVDMRKDMPADQISGENLGLLRLTEATWRRLVERAGELVAAGREQDWLGSALRDVARVRRIEAIDVAGLPWAEIDFPQDLMVARKQVWPAIARRARRARPPLRVLRWVAVACLALFVTLSSVRGWVRPHETVWEALEPTGGVLTETTSKGRQRPWWLLETGGATSVTVEGPTFVRIDARAPCVPREEGCAHYVLKVLLDGKQISWHALVSDPSGAWELAGVPLSKRSRIPIEIPAGVHQVEIHLVASDSDRCLVRFREATDDDA